MKASTVVPKTAARSRPSRGSPRTLCRFTIGDGIQSLRMSSVKVTIERSGVRRGITGSQLHHHELGVDRATGGGEGVEGDDRVLAQPLVVEGREHGHTDHGER